MKTAHEITLNEDELKQAICDWLARNTSHRPKPELSHIELGDELYNPHDVTIKWRDEF